MTGLIIANNVQNYFIIYQKITYKNYVTLKAHSVYIRDINCEGQVYWMK